MLPPLFFYEMIIANDVLYPPSMFVHKEVENIEGNHNYVEKHGFKTNSGAVRDLPISARMASSL